MADQLSLRGGTTTEHATFTGANKEVTVDTTKKTLVVNDGATVGGHPLMRENASNSALALGSAGTPSLKFTGSASTGIYSPGANQLAISTNGTQRINIEADGDINIDNGGMFYDATNNRLGIWTSSPGHKLDVNGEVAFSPNTAGKNTFYFTTNASNDASLFLKSDTTNKVNIQANGTSYFNGGNVGINTTSPSQKLQISTGNVQIDSNYGFIWDNSTTGIYGNSSPSVLQFYTGNAERARIDSSGRLLVGTSSAFSGSGISPKVTISNTAGIGLIAIGNADAGLVTQPAANTNYYPGFFLNSSSTGIGSIFCTSSATAFNTSSDYRLKENVVAVTDGISRLLQLKPSRFNFIIDPDCTVDGFIAHEAQAVVPECVTGEKDAVDADGNPKYQGIDQSKLVPLLTAALQEAIGEIESLKARLTAAGI